MQAFFKWLEEVLMPLLGRMANQRHLRTVRDGLVAIMPLTIVGSLPLLVANPFVPKPQSADGLWNSMILGWYNWLAQPGIKDMILTPQRISFGLMALFAAVTIAYYMARNYKMNELSAALVAGSTFLLVASPVEVINKVSVMPVDLLGGKGLFTSILIGILSVEITRFLKEKNFTIRMPDGVPPAVASAFDNMVPLFANLVIFYAISLLVKGSSGLLLPAFIMKILAPAVAAVDSPWMVFLAGFMANLFWFAGIHGATIISSAVLGAFFEQNLAANAAALTAGDPLPHIFTKMFWAFYMVIGGSGATLGLLLFYLRSKSAHLRSIGKVAILPAIFNINEPVIFGTPLVFNPILFFPFVTIQGLLGVIAYFVTKAGMVSAATVEAPWTAPAPLGAFFTTQDPKAALLSIALLALSTVIWYPFFKMFERQQLKQEAELTNTESEAA